MNTKTLLIGALLVILIAGALYYVLVLQQQAQPQVTPLEKEEKGLGGELFEKTGNPAQKVPETNPFREAETNPLQGTNPFEGAYQNPFE